MVPEFVPCSWFLLFDYDFEPVSNAPPAGTQTPAVPLQQRYTTLINTRFDSFPCGREIGEAYTGALSSVATASRESGTELIAGHERPRCSACSTPVDIDKNALIE